MNLFTRRLPPIVPRKVDPIPGVCGTAMHHIERGAHFDAILEACELTGRAGELGVELTIVARREVVGVPLPWSFGVAQGDAGAAVYVTVERLDHAVLAMVPGGPPHERQVRLSLRYGPTLAERVISVTPGK
jgi:hypothetical protein